MRGCQRRKGLVGALVIGLLLLSVLIAACGGGSTATTATSAAGASTTVAASGIEYRILVPAPVQVAFYPAYVAASQGFFAKRGVNVKMVVVDGSDSQITGLASGVGNIMYDAVTSFVVPDASKDFDPVAFYMAENIGLWDLVVPENSPIKELKELDGKVVGVTSPQDPGNTIVLNMNRVLGINAKTMIVNDAMQAMAAFDRGDIAAFSAVIVDITTIRARGVALRSIAPSEFRTVAGGMGYWAPRKLMQEHPADFKAISDALTEARAYIADDPQKLVAWMNSQEPIAEEDKAFSLALATAMIDLKPDDVKGGYIIPELFQQWWDGFVANKIIDPSRGKPTDFYTNEFNSK